MGFRGVGLGLAEWSESDKGDSCERFVASSLGLSLRISLHRTPWPWPSLICIRSGHTFMQSWWQRPPLLGTKKRGVFRRGSLLWNEKAAQRVSFGAGCPADVHADIPADVRGQKLRSGPWNPGKTSMSVRTSMIRRRGRPWPHKTSVRKTSGWIFVPYLRNCAPLLALALVVCIAGPSILQGGIWFRGCDTLDSAETPFAKTPLFLVPDL